MIVHMPKNKHDIDFCKNIDTFSDKLIIDNLDNLLKWTEDINWPITNCIHNRISKIDIQFLISPIETILQGEDSLFKYSIMQSLIPKLDKKDFHYLSRELQRISTNPTKTDIEEELDEIAQEILSGF